MTDDILDLDAERESRAAAREGKALTLPIRLGGQVIATLPPELPLDALAPLRNLDGDLTLILREAMTAVKQKTPDANAAATDMVVDLLAANPALPGTVLDTFKDVVVGLIGDDGFADLMAQRPSAQDFGALTKGVFRFYGVTLGEAFSSSDSSTNSGGTSSTTSSTTSGSTPEGSGSAPETKDSLESVGS